VRLVRGLRVTADARGETTLSGSVPDQAALHGVRGRIRDLGLVLRSARRRDRDAGQGGRWTRT
jgi:hypothetical protein